MLPGCHLVHMHAAWGHRQTHSCNWYRDQNKVTKTGTSRCFVGRAVCKAPAFPLFHQISQPHFKGTESTSLPTTYSNFQFPQRTTACHEGHRNGRCHPAGSGPWLQPAINSSVQPRQPRKAPLRHRGERGAIKSPARARRGPAAPPNPRALPGLCPKKRPGSGRLQAAAPAAAPARRPRSCGAARPAPRRPGLPAAPGRAPLRSGSEASRGARPPARRPARAPHSLRRGWER